MAIASQVIVEGSVIRMESRTVKKKDGSGDITFNTALVVGEHCMAQVSIPDGHELPKPGFKGRALVEVSVYREDDQMRLIQWIG